MKSENELASPNGCLNINPKSTVIQYANAVPSRPGFNQCEFCNIIAPVASFFSSSKRFCSCVCSRSFSSSMRDHGNSSKNNERRRTLFAMNMRRRAELQEMEKEKNNALNRSFDWGEHLEMEDGFAAPVGSFPHCSRSELFQRPLDCRKVEIVNQGVSESVPVYWIATIIRTAGYLIKVRLEGYEDDCAKDGWLHVFNDEVHPLTWCALNKRELVIPIGLQDKAIDWISYLRPRLSESFSLSDDFEESKEREKKLVGPLKRGMKVEVINKHNLSCMKVATVEQNIGGRLILKYDDSKVEDNYFWCHSLSDLIHHIGWSCMVGHDIDASQEYKDDSIRKLQEKQFDEWDATPQMFEEVAELRRNRLNYGKKIESHKTPKSPPSSPSSPQVRFVSGMKLEVVDPSNPSCICAATVVKTLKHNFIMVKKDSVISFEQQNLQRDLFCFHSRSPYILPAGFCLANDLKLVPPIGYNGEFDWKEYSEATGSMMAPIGLFAASQIKPLHRFEIRMKIEAANLRNPKQICVATITKIAGRLLRVRLESFEDVTEQWMDVFSPDIYPVGWCQAFGHPLEAPRPKMTPLTHNKIIKKQKRISLTKGGRKRKKMRPHDQQGDVDTSDGDDDYVCNALGDNSECEKGESGKDFLSESSPTYSPYGCGFDTKPHEKSKSSDESDADVISKVSALRASEIERKNIFSQLSDEKYESKVSASLFCSPGTPGIDVVKQHDETSFTLLKSGIKVEQNLVR